MPVRWISNRHTSHTLVGIETGKTRSLVRFSITKEKKEKFQQPFVLGLGWTGGYHVCRGWEVGRKGVRAVYVVAEVALGVQIDVRYSLVMHQYRLQLIRTNTLLIVLASSLFSFLLVPFLLIF